MKLICILFMFLSSMLISCSFIKSLVGGIDEPSADEVSDEGDGDDEGNGSDGDESSSEDLSGASSPETEEDNQGVLIDPAPALTPIINGNPDQIVVGDSGNEPIDHTAPIDQSDDDVSSDQVEEESNWVSGIIDGAEALWTDAVNFFKEYYFELTREEEFLAKLFPMESFFIYNANLTLFLSIKYNENARVLHINLKKDNVDYCQTLHFNKLELKFSDDGNFLNVNGVSEVIVPYVFESGLVDLKISIDGDSIQVSSVEYPEERLFNFNKVEDSTSAPRINCL